MKIIHTWKILTKANYKQIGLKVGLTGQTLNNYIKFMKLRFPKERDTTYATEWANRFRKGEEWDVSDSGSRAILMKIDKMEYYRE